jgi:hypothetical protein
MLCEESSEPKCVRLQETGGLLVRGNQSFHLPPQSGIAKTGFLEESFALARFLLKGSFEQLLKLLKTFRSH